MSSPFGTETVLDVRHWTDAYFSFTITRDDGFRFENGQFVMIGLPVEQPDGSTRPLMRAYSIASANWEEQLEFFSIKVQDGPLTSRLQHIQPGDSILIGRKPTGTLLIHDLHPGRNLYLLGTGTGFAPWLAVIKDPETYDRFERVILCHGVRNVGDLAYRDYIVNELPQHEFLGEQVRARRWAAVAVGFLGVLLIVRPGSTSFTVGTLVAISAAVLSALVAIQIKQLSRTEPADRIVLYTTMLWVPMSLLPAVFVWTWPQGITWLWVAAAGTMGTCGHMFWTRALKLGDVSALTPISFMQLPVVAVFGWWLFGERLDHWTIAGAAIIFGANAYIAHREATLACNHATQAPAEAAQPNE